ncbi:MAG: DinB family protein, partial [Pseudomonadota bacterium]
AAYNRWMNEQLFAVCAEIPDAERKRDMGAFFSSIHGTLNHLLLSDRLWMGRLTGEPFTITSLAQELYADFDDLRREREHEDQRILQWVAKLTEADLDSVISYISVVDKQQRRFRVEDVLLHLFHHQTHHRGQITTLISQLGHDFGETDLAFMPGMPAESDMQKPTPSKK